MGQDQKNSRERFGRYLILDHLVDGGMAKICRARFLGEQADKVVAIKMVQPQFSRDEAFKTMFMDEIKLTFGLIHPNIVQVYDYGYHKEQLFVAMEYCDGRNLKEYLEKLKERKFVFPVEISVYIITQVCQALYYAHTFTDKLTGEERGIIHRDISPHNIMLTYDGTVKVIDFGIAKSKTNSEATQAGTIKGKLSYLAPEYLEGYELDPRYDEFAVGITLWEMLCSRKLFKDNNDLAVLKKIQECRVPPPSSINPNVPKELDEIVLKALSKNRNNRYDNMDQLNRALMKFLYSKYPDFNATDLSYFAQELFKEDIKKDREKMFEFGRIDIKPYFEEMKNEIAGISSRPSDSVKIDSGSIAAKNKETIFDMGFEDTSKVEKTKVHIGKKRSLDDHSSSINRNAANDTSNTVESPTAITLEVKKIQKKDLTTIVPKNTRTDKLANTKYKVEKVEVKSGNSIVKSVASLLIFGLIAGYVYNHYEKVKKNRAIATARAADEQQVRKPSSDFGINTNTVENEASVIIGHYDKLKHRIFIDGVPVTPDLIGSIKVPLNQSMILRVQVPGRKHFIKELLLEEQKSYTIDIPTDLPTSTYAYLITSRVCAKGEMTYEVFGEKRKSRIPISESVGIAFPLEFDQSGANIVTTHTIEVKLDSEEVTRSVEFKINREEETIDLCNLL